MKKKTKYKMIFNSRYLFILAVGIIYFILFFIDPEKTFRALSASAGILGYIIFPLSLVLVLMIFLNLFLKPSHVTRLLGEKAGFRGVMLAAAAGIISMGPIYAWYPLLKEVRAKGAGNTAIAVFLSNRAVKPFLLPVMISYFGWIYVLLLTVLLFIASVVLGYVLDALCRSIFPDSRQTCQRL